MLIYILNCKPCLDVRQNPTRKTHFLSYGRHPPNQNQPTIEMSWSHTNWRSYCQLRYYTGRHSFLNNLKFFVCTKQCQKWAEDHFRYSQQGHKRTLWKSVKFKSSSLMGCKAMKIYPSEKNSMLLWKMKRHVKTSQNWHTSARNSTTHETFNT